VGRRLATLGLALLAAGCAFDRSGGNGARDSGTSPQDGGDVDDPDGGGPDGSGPCMTGALDFSPDQWVEVADDSLDLRDDFAVQAWVKPREVAGEYHIVSRHDAAASEGYVLMIKDQLPEFRVYFPDDSGPATHCDCTMAGEEVTAGEWVHLAGSYSAGTSYLYKNGVVIAICHCQDLCGDGCVGEIAGSDGPLAIGIEASRLDRFAADGLIDDVHLHAGPITASFDPMESGGCAADSLLLFRFEAPVGQELASGCGTGVTGRLGAESGSDVNDPTAVETACPAL
jgi:hypothetical protein